MRRSPSQFAKVLLLLVTAVAVIGLTQNVLARELSNHTPKFAQTAPDMGLANPSQMMTIKVHLQKGAADQLSSFIQQLHDPSSANFQKWLTPDQFKAKFGASLAEAANVQKFLAGNNLKVVASDRMSITARGTVSDIQKAFHTQIHNFKVNGKMVRGNISNPIIESAAGDSISSVSGLAQVMAVPHNKHQVDADLKPTKDIPLAGFNPNGAFFSSQCFPAASQPTTVNLSGVVANVPAGNPLAGQTATATYTGPKYGGCAYQPSELATAYQFNSLYKQGLDGTGESVVIVDAFGSPTLQADFDLFNLIYGLPAQTITTFNVNVTGVGPGSSAGFATETTLDVEWAHAVAPGAKIILVLGADNSFDNLNAAVQFAIENKLGPVISNSYGAPENLIDDATFAATEAIIAEGAAAGVSVNYSSGDDGDFSIDFDPPVTTVSYPSASPFATSIGGTSLVLNPDNTLKFQTGWGLNDTRLSLAASGANNPVVPPNNDPALGLGFLFGAGGGPSAVFPKPHFQRRQPGKFRQQPDISYLADPETGVEVIQTIGGTTFVEIIGGTSLACPMFSALWAITAQAAGNRNIGQAAQTVYELGDHAIDDIRPSRAGNVTGVIHIPGKTIVETAADLSAPLFNQKRFLSALLQGASTSWFNITFGTDSSLTVDEGWDNVTGLGTPNAPNFVPRVLKEVGKGKGKN